jgi:hypothetical protein
MTVEIPGELVLVDVHGVVAGFAEGAAELFGHEPDTSKYRYDFWRDWPEPVSDKKFWKRIDKAGADFWAGLPCLSTGYRLIQELRDAGVEWAFCTAAVTHPGSYEGTRRFCNDWFGDCRLIGTTEKYELAGPNRLLIDDHVENVERFIEAGGVGYVWPQPWNVRPILDTLLDFTKLKAIQGVMG